MASSQTSFFDLPAPVRQRIYTHLLAPHPDENETVINYSLRWNWLENPSNTTFGGNPQIDLCRCPRQSVRVKNTKTKDHMYTRYKCHGPEVIFNSTRQNLWVPSPGYPQSGQINFLRPAHQEELARRPNANFLSTCRIAYEEASPVLYRGRNFLFVAGPCPRGRYQAYATQTFFARLSPLARLHVTACSTTIVPHEEDCRTEDIERAYRDLAMWIRRNLPSFRTLGITLWDGRLKGVVKPFEHLFQKDGVTIQLDWGQADGWVEEIEDVEGFRTALQEKSHETQRTRAGALWEEAKPNELPACGRKLEFTSKPEVLLERWRAKGDTTPQGGWEEDEDEWSDALPTPATSTRGRVDEDGWDII